MKPEDLKPGDIIKLTHPTVTPVANPWVGTIGEFIRLTKIPPKRPAIEIKVIYLNPELYAANKREGQVMTFPTDSNGWHFKLVCKDWDT